LNRGVPCPQLNSPAQKGRRNKKMNEKKGEGETFANCHFLNTIAGAEVGEEKKRDAEGKGGGKGKLEPVAVDSNLIFPQRMRGRTSRGKQEESRLSSSLPGFFPPKGKKRGKGPEEKK